MRSLRLRLSDWLQRLSYVLEDWSRAVYPEPPIPEGAVVQDGFIAELWNIKTEDLYKANLRAADVAHLPKLGGTTIFSSEPDGSNALTVGDVIHLPKYKDVIPHG